MKLLSICIVNWNTKSFLRETLASIEASIFPHPIEVIIVDNASSDGSAEMVSREFPDHCLIRNDVNQGYAAANNQAIEASSGDWLLFLNPDVRLFPDTIEKAVDAACELPLFGALGIKQIGADGHIQNSLRSFPEPVGILWELLKFSKLFPRSKFFSSYRMTWFDYSSTIEVDQPMATFLLTTRAVINKTGGLDPDFPIFFNDVDWCYRVKNLGFKIYYTDRAETIHYGGMGTSKAGKAKMAAESKRSFLLFYEKHYRGKLPKLIYDLATLAVQMSLRSRSKMIGFKRT